MFPLLGSTNKVSVALKVTRNTQSISTTAHRHMSTSELVIGIDVGATATQAALFTHSAQRLSVVTGIAANPHVIGFTASTAEICRLITELLIPHPKSFPSSLAVCLSGGESAALRERYRSCLRTILGCLPSAHILVIHDVVAPVGFIIPSAADGSNNLGLVTLIGGTGSVAAGFTISAGEEELIPDKDVCVDGKVYKIYQHCKCGGWGPLLGDKGSGYWVTSTTLATALQIWDGVDAKENVVNNRPPHDGRAILDELQMATEILQLACRRWLGSTSTVSLANLDELVAHIHSLNTSRGDIASLCADLAYLAIQGNTICKRVFRAAGTELGLLFCTVLQNLLSSSACLSSDRVRAIATGGVFGVWDSVGEFSAAFLDAVAPFLKAGVALYLQSRQPGREADYDLPFACARLSMMIASNKEVTNIMKTNWENDVGVYFSQLVLGREE